MLTNLTTQTLLALRIGESFMQHLRESEGFPISPRDHVTFNEEPSAVQLDYHTPNFFIGLHVRIGVDSGDIAVRQATAWVRGTSLYRRGSVTFVDGTLQVEWTPIDQLAPV